MLTLPIKAYSLDPLSDSRWPGFVHDHPRSSVFHSLPWLEALRRTYRYQPVAFTTSPPGAALQNSIVFCSIDSWLTGRRLVSLPFSDHCEPLFDFESESDMTAIRDLLLEESRRKKLRYVELRPLNSPALVGLGLRCCRNYIVHRLDLTPGLDVLYRNLHKEFNATKDSTCGAGAPGINCHDS